MLLEITIPLLLCISPYVGEDDASVFGRAAQHRGYDVQTGTGAECAATLYASDSDWAGVSLLGYDDGTLDGGKPQPLTLDRAADILTAWEARF